MSARSNRRDFQSSPKIVRKTKKSVVGVDFGTRAQLVGFTDLVARSRRRRLSFLVTIALLWGCLVTYRLSVLQVSDPSKWQGSANRQHFQPFRVAESRAPIVDREGRLLSVSVSAGSVYVRPKQVPVDEHPRIAKSVAKILDIRESDVLQKLQSKKPFVWVARQVPRPQAETIRTLKLPGVDYMIEARRFYPFGDAASSLIGKVGIDGTGLSGLEQVYDVILKGDEARSSFARDGIGNVIEATPAVSMERMDEKTPGALELTIDAFLQQIVDEELEIGRLKASAQRAMAVLVDAETGDILGMGQAPQADYNTGGASSDVLRNIIAETVYEPGSTLKAMVAAAALDAGVVGRNEPIDCEKGHFYYAGHHINDVHPVATVPFRDVIVRSSNIGMTKVGIRLGADRLYDYLTKFGLGSSTGLGLPGETKGILRNVDTWAKIDVATHSFGQGVAVTPLQMVRAMSALANDGVIPDLRVIRVEEDDIIGERIISAKSAKVVQDYLYGVVEDEKGTGKKAAIPGVRVGGKTGTAQKARTDGRGYEADKYVASFVGFVDGSLIGVDRTLSLIVIIDEPNTDTIYGGMLAAPVFQKIMTRTLKYLGMSRELRRGIEPGYTVASRRKPERGSDLADASHNYEAGKS